MDTVYLCMEHADDIICVWSMLMIQAI